MRRALLVVILAVACTSPPETAPVAMSQTPTANPTLTVGPSPAAATALPTSAPATRAPATPTAASAPATTPSATRCTTQHGGDQGVNRAPGTMRAAGHAGYDRVVIDFGPLGPTQFGGPIPQFAIEQVDRVTSGGSGHPIPMQGSVFIRVHFRAAGGAGEYAGPRRLLPDTTVVREVIFTEFEGATTIGIGLTRLVCPVPSIWPEGRLVLDFHH